MTILQVYLQRGYQPSDRKCYMATRESKIIHPQAGLSASMHVLERNSDFTVFTDPLEKVHWHGWMFQTSMSYLRFEGRFTSPVAISISTILVISVAGWSGHLQENIQVQAQSTE